MDGLKTYLIQSRRSGVAGPDTRYYRSVVVAPDETTAVTMWTNLGFAGVVSNVTEINIPKVVMYESE